MIQVRDLTKSYGSRTVLDSVSFDVAAGTITGFLGLNGAGKTTTMRILAGLAAPDRGQACIAGRPLAAHREPWRQVGVMLEECAAHPGARGRDHLRVLARLAGLPGQRVDECLELVGLAEAGYHRVRTYSLGMRQRLSLAAAILARPRVLVLDEPGNGLDAAGLRLLRELLTAHAAAGGTVFLSSHRIAELEDLADDVVAVHQGRIIRQGPITALLPTGRLLVRSPEPGLCQQVLSQHRYQVEAGPDGQLLVPGAEPEPLSRLLAAARVPIYELRPTRPTLEDFFFGMVRPQSPEEEHETADLR